MYVCMWKEHELLALEDDIEREFLRCLPIVLWYSSPSSICSSWVLAPIVLTPIVSKNTENWGSQLLCCLLPSLPGSCNYYCVVNCLVGYSYAKEQREVSSQHPAMKWLLSPTVCKTDFPKNHLDKLEFFPLPQLEPSGWYHNLSQWLDGNFIREF